eukprot:4816231-Ditylum_brightwellii.AAC.1
MCSIGYTANWPALTAADKAIWITHDSAAAPATSTTTASLNQRKVIKDIPNTQDLIIATSFGNPNMNPQFSFETELEY